MSKILHGIQTLTGKITDLHATPSAQRLFDIFTASNPDRDGESVFVRFIQNDSGGALTGGLGLIQKSTANLGYARIPTGATEVASQVIGVTPYDGGTYSLPDDQGGYVITHGPAKVVAGGAFSKGDPLKIDAAGKFVQAAVTVAVLAYAEEDSSGADVVVKVIMRPNG